MGDAGERPAFDAKAAWKRICENRDKLDACPRHHFEPLGLEGIRLGAKATCTECGGEMDLTKLNFYIRGYEAAGKNGNDILPGWKPEGATAEVMIKRRFFRAEE